MTLRGGFSPSSGLMCEIVNSVDQGNFTFFRKSQRISENSGCVQIKTTIFGMSNQAISSHHGSNCSFAFLQFEVVTN